MIKGAPRAKYQNFRWNVETSFGPLPKPPTQLPRYYRFEYRGCGWGIEVLLGFAPGLDPNPKKFFLSFDFAWFFLIRSVDPGFSRPWPSWLHVTFPRAPQKLYVGAKLPESVANG